METKRNIAEEKTGLEYRKTRRVYEEENGSKENFEAEVTKYRVSGEGGEVLYSYEFEGDLAFKKPIITVDDLDLAELLEEAIQEYFCEEDEYYKEYLEEHELTCSYRRDFQNKMFEG